MLVVVPFDNNNDIYLTPAACLAIYPELSKLEIENEIITIIGNVFRVDKNIFTFINEKIEELITDIKLPLNLVK